MTTRTERFQRKPAEKTEDVQKDEEEEVIRFSPEEEAVCILQSYLESMLIKLAVTPRRV